MATPYTHTTWGQVKTTLAERLHDSNNSYWEDAELGFYLAEALRTWNVCTSFWRDRGVILTSADVAFYDLASLPLRNADDNAELVSCTVTDQDLVKYIQYHFLEPATGDSWTGSEQFTLEDLTKALQRRRNQFLSDTGCVVTRTTGIPTTPGNPSMFLPDTVIAIRRLAFVTAGGTVYPLYPTDILSQRNYASTALYEPGTAYSYSTGSSRPLEIDLAPPFAEPGTLDLIAVETGEDLDPTTGVVLGIPDDYAPFIKWGAMADLLAKDGPARDPVRSAYCERRYHLGVLLALNASVVENAEINGVPLDTDSLPNLDSYDSSWQNETGAPFSVASIRTLAALGPCPDGVYSATFDVVCKAPIPVGITEGTDASDNTFIQIGREQLDAIIDYAEHLALFKSAGEEFKSTFKGADNFFSAAVAYNERLAADNPNIVNLMKQSTADNEDRQFMVPRGIGVLSGQPASGGSGTIAGRPSQNYIPPDMDSEV